MSGLFCAPGPVPRPPGVPPGCLGAMPSGMVGPVASHRWGQGHSGASRALPALSAAEARQVGRYRRSLQEALRTRDRQALHTAKQAVLRSAYRQPASPPLRRALRELSWWMAGMLLPR